MMQTLMKGVAVEVYFKQYARNIQIGLALEKEDFSEAMRKLNLKWADSIQISQIFDEIDQVTHG